jgi:hypothetical protein
MIGDNLPPRATGDFTADVEAVIEHDMPQLHLEGASIGINGSMATMICYEGSRVIGLLRIPFTLLKGLALDMGANVLDIEQASEAPIVPAGELSGRIGAAMTKRSQQTRQ